jgi:hypothetical protein
MTYTNLEHGKSGPVELFQQEQALCSICIFVVGVIHDLCSLLMSQQLAHTAMECLHDGRPVSFGTEKTNRQMFI